MEKNSFEETKKIGSSSITGVSCASCQMCAENIEK